MFTYTRIASERAKQRSRDFRALLFADGRTDGRPDTRRRQVPHLA